MGYLPRTPAAFPGDLQHDFRDHQADARLETLSLWLDVASGHSLRAAGLLWAFRHWLTERTGLWAQHTPQTLRLMLLCVVTEHTASGRGVGVGFFRTLADIYTLPGQTVPKPQVDPFC